MKRLNILLLSYIFLLPFAVHGNSLFTPTPNFTLSNSDTVKYKGYRLELTNFKMVKEKSDWLKISFTIVNSGRMNVDLGREGTEHWVTFNFDKSIFKAKLGGYRDNIKRQLTKDNFKLDAGHFIKNMELKIPNVLPLPPKKSVSKPIVSTKPKQNTTEEAANSLAWNTSEAPTLLPNNKPSEESPQPLKKQIAEKTIAKEKTPCPDILISDLKIIQQDEKWATIQYTVTNQGDGVYYLFGKSANKNDNLVVSAYLSGVTTLTRGAIPIGGQVITKEVRTANELKKGERLIARIKLNVRKKTRYMKSLILSVKGQQHVDECDRKNNSMGVVLE